MKTYAGPIDIETDARHHDLRRYRAQVRGVTRRQTKQALSHLTRAAALCSPFADGDENGALLWCGALPAEVSIE